MPMDSEINLLESKATEDELRWIDGSAIQPMSAGTYKFGHALTQIPMRQGGWKELFHPKVSARVLGKKKALNETVNDKIITAIALHNTREMLRENGYPVPSDLTKLTEAVMSPQVSGFVDFLFPIIRAAMPRNIAMDLVSVQPITRRGAEIFYMDLIIGSNKGQFTKGQRYADALTGYNNMKDYTSENVNGEIIGTANGALTTFNATLQSRPIRRNTVRVVAGAVIAHDDANGNLVGVGVTSGTINYETGSIQITYAVAPALNDDPVASYRYDSEVSGTIPVVEFSIKSEVVSVVQRAIRTLTSMNASYDARRELGLDMEQMLTGQIAQVIQAETNREIISHLWDMAGAPVTQFSASQPGVAPHGFTLTEHFRDLMYRINVADGTIFRQNQRFGATWLVADVNAATIIKSMPAPSFVPADNDADISTMGVRYIGRLGKLGVYEDPYLDQEPGASDFGNILVGFKGSGFAEAGYVHATYMPLVITPNITLDDFLTRRAAATRYAYKRIERGFYKRISFVA